MTSIVIRSIFELKGGRRGTLIHGCCASVSFFFCWLATGTPWDTHSTLTTEHRNHKHDIFAKPPYPICANVRIDLYHALVLTTRLVAGTDKCTPFQKVTSWPAYKKDTHCVHLEDLEAKSQSPPPSWESKSRPRNQDKSKALISFHLQPSGQPEVAVCSQRGVMHVFTCKSRELKNSTGPSPTSPAKDWHPHLTQAGITGNR